MEDHAKHALNPDAEERADNLRRRFGVAHQPQAYDWRFDSWSAPWRQAQLFGLRAKYWLTPVGLGLAIACGGVFAYDHYAAISAWLRPQSSVPFAAPARSQFDSAEMQRRHQYASHGCREAAEVGLAPAYRGEPGYWPQNDGDGDGIACERYGPGRR